MKKIFCITIVVLFLVSCAPSQSQIEKAIAETQAAMPTETATPLPTSTPEPTPTEKNQNDKYRRFLEEFNFLFKELVKNEKDAVGIKNTDLYFEQSEEGTILRSNLSVSLAQRDAIMPFALSFTIAGHIIAGGKIDYPEDMSAYVITLYDDVYAKKIKTYELKWVDFMEYVDEKITFEQVYTRMEKSD